MWEALGIFLFRQFGDFLKNLSPFRSKAGKSPRFNTGRAEYSWICRGGMRVQKHVGILTQNAFTPNGIPRMPGEKWEREIVKIRLGHRGH
jgi:hypothetical protein